MLQKEVTKEQVMHMAEELLHMLDPKFDTERFDHGFSLYRNGNVYNTEVKDNTIKATVFDDHPVAVELDFDFFLMSECEADDSIPCAHKIAVFLYVYSSFATVGEFIYKWNELKEKTEKKQQKQQVRQTPNPLPAPNVPSDSLSDWLAFFDHQYENFLILKQREVSFYNENAKHGYIVEKMPSTYYDSLIRNSPNDVRLKLIYTIHAAVTVIAKMLNYIKSNHVEWTSGHFVYMPLEKLRKEIEAATEQLEKYTLSKRHLQLLEESIERFDVLLENDEEFLDLSLYIYRTIWATLLNEKNWIKKHEKKVKDRLAGIEKTAGEESLVVPFQIALTHFAFLLEDDKLAMKRAEKLPKGYISTFFYMIEYTFFMKQPERMIVWLDFTKSKLTPFLTQEGQYRAKREYTDFLLHYYNVYGEFVQSDSAYVTAMKEMLPYSFYEYNDYLLHMEKYKDWAELQLLVGFQPEAYSQKDLRKIELADRTFLLPLYHQAVQQAISEKNRQAYKLAVKRLKKLRTHYRQLKKMNLWDRYIALIAKKHKRLRAFQEELKKGMLIND
ncbi:hypothetical protein DCC39_15020 [Pueribacillus theae]|uniref:SWIM-type domain-containing protein n=1 Tax=Pueribacillus theae TaxID=2171751 RepID=A0A2U1JU65_9BACI|nr:hypothetical protein [Pueribacillus theae]PWA08393.1 hypothetical protein DCC39_15020 [Pueribacillus theae]